MTSVLQDVVAQLRDTFSGSGITAPPEAASVTFLGAEPIQVLKFGPDGDGVNHYVSLGCSRHPMVDPTDLVVDQTRGPRAEVVVTLSGATPAGLARSIAVVAASPAVEGLILTPDALVDLETPLWAGAPFTAMLLGHSDIDDVQITSVDTTVTILSATPVTATEAAWVRLKGAEAMREAWRADGVDVRDPGRPAAQPK
ncbi:MAG: suppressor of fused domain protein [Mycobacterium sp.]